MEWIFHIGIAQSFFSAFILFSKKSNNLADRILASWMIFISLELWHMLFEINHSPIHAYSSNFGFYSLTFGPFLFLYVSKLTQENPRFTAKDLLHFLPYLVYSLTHLLFYTNRVLKSDLVENDLGWFMLNILRVISLFLSLAWYSFLAYKLLIKHKETVKDSYSIDSSKVTLSWLNQIIIIFVVTYVILIINLLTGNVALKLLNTSHLIPAIGLTFFCFSLSYFGFIQPNLFQAANQPIALSPQAKEDELLNGEKRKKYWERIQAFMHKEKPFLNPELTIKELADCVKLPRHYITELLKSEVDKNFFTFVNNYRMEEVKSRLVSDKYRKASVLQIALDSGFNSKSSFNAIFKQDTGMTPSEFRKSMS